MAKKKYKIGICVDPHLVERNPRCRSDHFLEVALAKLEYIAKNNDFVIIAGDLFHIHNNGTLFFNTVHTLFNKYKGKWHAILGNHDVFNRNLSALNRTTIGSLYYTGVLDLHTTRWDLCGLHFEPCLVDQEVKDIPIDVDNTSILIGHKYLESGFAEETLTKDDIRYLGYKMVFLGHDHKPYEEDFIGDSTVIRMGSLTRIDTQEYNKDRDIVYYQIKTTGDGDFDYSRVIIPCAPSAECYLDEAYQHMCATSTNKKEISFVQIGDVLAKFVNRNSGINSLDKTLRRLNTPERSISDIKWKHELAGIQYT